MLAAFKDHIKEPGFYFFPAPEDKPGMTSRAKGEVHGSGDATHGQRAVGDPDRLPAGPADQPGDRDLPYSLRATWW